MLEIAFEREFSVKVNSRSMLFHVIHETQCGNFIIFSIIQTLREINFEDSWNANSAILQHLEALNFDFYEFLHFVKAENYQMNNIHSSP